MAIKVRRLNRMRYHMTGDTVCVLKRIKVGFATVENTKYIGFLSHPVRRNFVLVTKRENKIRKSYMFLGATMMATHRMVLIEKTIPWEDLTSEANDRTLHRVSRHFHGTAIIGT